jgi:acetyl esterase/lipase
MPPTYIVLASCDPMADEVELFHELLAESGVESTLKKYKGMPHGFHNFHGLQAAREEMKESAGVFAGMIRG